MSIDVNTLISVRTEVLKDLRNIRYETPSARLAFNKLMFRKIFQADVWKLFQLVTIKEIIYTDRYICAGNTRSRAQTPR